MKLRSIISGVVAGVVVGGIAVVAVLLFRGSDDDPGGDKATPAPEYVYGTFDLYDGWRNDGSNCSGTGGYSDVGPGMEVLLTADGKTLDVARFGSGSRLNTRVCRFNFSLVVPPGHEFYTVTVGRRGDRTYRANEILIDGALAYTLGQ